MIIFRCNLRTTLVMMLCGLLAACGPTPAVVDVEKNAKELRETLPSAERWLKTKAAPDDWHRFAMGANWDFVPLSTFKWIIEQPNCDRATALLVFWLSSPEFFAERDGQKLTSDEQELADLGEEIRRRFKTGQYQRSELEFRLKEDAGVVNHETFDKKYGAMAARYLPIEMRINLVGRRLSLEGTSDGIPSGLFRNAPPWGSSE